MNSLGILFALTAAALLFVLPRPGAIVALLLGAVYVTVGQVIEVGPFHFTLLRLLIAVGFLRALFRGERLAGRWNSMDKAMILWGCWAICSSLFHNKPGNALVYMLGITYTCLGSYFLMRIFIRDFADLITAAKIVTWLLVPVAAEMVLEKLTARNLFSVFGYVSEESLVRHGKIRAQGAFSHPILAGTVGAVCLPLAGLLWRRNRWLACLGFAATGGMILASASSGPILSALAIAFALAIWRVRMNLRWIMGGGVLALLGLELIMNDPVYYLMARVDLTGSSTGWHRATLIRAAIEHFSEWWMAGTDYTRHWMPTGVPWSPDHTDITNHYLRMAVWGGLPLMLLFIGVIWAAFARLSRALRWYENSPQGEQFGVWTLGAILFGHCVTFLSIAYFDQSVIFLYLLLAMIGGLETGEVSAVRARTLEPGVGWSAAQYESDFCHNR